MNRCRLYCTIYFIFFIFIIFCLFGCENNKTSKVKSDDNANLIIPIENDIQTLDPSQLSDPYTSRIVWQIYEGLVGLNKDGLPIPIIAKSWQNSSDFKEWIFSIRPNVYFHQSKAFNSDHNSRSVTSQDVVYSYTRFAKGFGSFVFSGLVVGLDDYLSDKSKTISGFAAIDELTFKISLTRPDPAFIYRITSPYLCIMPKEVIQTYPDDFGKSIASGTGPFKLHSRNETQVIIDKNTDYWRVVPGNLKKIIFKVDKNPQIRVAQFEKGIYGLMDIPITLKSKFFIDSELTKDWKSSHHIYKAKTFNVHYLGFDNKKLPDKRLRKAIKMAVDKKAIVNGLLKGFAISADELVPPGLQGFEANIAVDFDINKAKIELQQSKYNGESIEFLISDIANHEAVGQLIQSQLNNIGIKVNIQRVDLNTLISRLFSDNRPEMFLAFSEWVFSAPELILESYNSSRFPNPNITGYANPEVDKLIEKTFVTNDRIKINKYCKEISYIVGNDAPLVPLYHLTKNIMIKNMYSDFYINGHQYWDLKNIIVK